MTTSSITSALGAGSGIDITALVGSLVDNQFSVKTKQLQSKSDALTAQISGASTIKSAIGGFASALTTLVRGGTLATSPTSSNAAVARVATLSGARPTQLAGTLDVRQLAKPQSAASALVADRTAAIGTGSFTLTFGNATVADGAMTRFDAGGGTPVAIAIDAAHTSLDGIASAINAAGAGVTASIVGDAGGSRLVLKGATGASQAFTLTSEDAGLSDLAVGVGASGTTIGSVAQDAIVVLDGIAVRRSSNTVNNLVDGVRIELVGTGTSTLGVTPPTAALTQAVGDFVETYNQLLATLKAQTDAKTGALRSDPAALTLQRQLGQLATTRLTSDASGPRTLSELGVATNRDGTLRVDTARLAQALTRYPAAAEAIFADGTGASEHGLAAALATIATAATGTAAGLGASESRYARARTDLGDQQAKALADADTLRTQLTTQFARMDARVAAYKSTQTFLTNQIAAWNKSSD